MELIVASTKNGADFFGAQDLGTIERGKWADLLVLQKNPLDGIKNTGRFILFISPEI
jgi:imidazolonepropionase-like amidohydrolase